MVMAGSKWWPPKLCFPGFCRSKGQKSRVRESEVKIIWRQLVPFCSFPFSTHRRDIIETERIIGKRGNLENKEKSKGSEGMKAERL